MSNDMKGSDSKMYREEAKPNLLISEALFIITQNFCENEITSAEARLTYNFTAPFFKNS